MAAIIKILTATGCPPKSFQSFFDVTDRFVRTHGFQKLSSDIYFTELHISPTLIKTIINTIKIYPFYKQVVKHIYYTVNLTKI